MQETRARVKAFFARHFPGLDVRDDSDIFGMGFVNSLFAMQLVLFVEKEFDVRVENDDLDLENFRSVNAIVRFVERKQAPVS
jgi:acyl carrier protein